MGKQTIKSLATHRREASAVALIRIITFEHIASFPNAIQVASAFPPCSTDDIVPEVRSQSAMASLTTRKIWHLLKTMAFVVAEVFEGLSCCRGRKSS